MIMTDEEVFTYMSRDMLPPSARALASAAEEYRSKTVREFTDLVMFLFKQAIGGLIVEAGAKDIWDFSRRARIKMLFETVIQFNAALPLDYPNVVIALQFAEPPSLSLSAFERSSIRALNDALTPGMLILAQIQKESDYESGSCDVTFRIVYPKAADDIEEPNPDE